MIKDELNRLYNQADMLEIEYLELMAEMIKLNEKIELFEIFYENGIELNRN